MLTEMLKDWAVSGMKSGGYPVAALLMALESMIAPVPSEIVMPPLGMLLHPDPATGIAQFTWEGAMIATSLGSLIGSIISYYLGFFGGKPLVMKVGKWFLINEQHLDLSSAWFKRWGSLTVFGCRFVPVVRHFISIPAGVARMNILKFCLYTLLGASLWNGGLLWLGWKLQSKWEEILVYRRPLDAGIVVVLVAGVVAWYWIHLRKPKSVGADVVTQEDSKAKP